MKFQANEKLVWNTSQIRVFLRYSISITSFVRILRILLLETTF